MGCKLFYSADLPVLTVRCHAPLVTLGSGCVFGQKPKADPSVLTLGITYACGEGRVAGQHSSQVEKYGSSKASVRVFFSQAFGATLTQGVLLCVRGPGMLSRYSAFSGSGRVEAN